MGVSGSGKSFVGESLAKELSFPFIEGDDYHTAENIDKMRRGIPLQDADRLPWLDQLHEVAVTHKHTGCVIACSALKKKYRERLSLNIEQEVQWIYLKGSYDQILERMQNRKDHFMPPEMLLSQFETLEEPEGAIEINIAESPEILVQKIKSRLQ